MSALEGKHVLLGVTASISAYKACDIIQRLKENGALVKVVMTPSAAKIIPPLTLKALSGSPVHTHIFSDQAESGMEHIDLARWADIYLVAPCTANTLGELAHGLTGSMVSALYLSFGKPVFIAPAMNSTMLSAPAVRENLATLRERGDVVLPSKPGVLACGEVGEGKLLDPDSMVEYLKAGQALTKVYPKIKGKKCLIALGHTREKIDDIRYLSNRSSGKTGLAIARMLELAGAHIHLVCGALDHPLPLEYDRPEQLTRVESSLDFKTAIENLQPQFDILIMAAAISDFEPENQIPGKKTDSKGLKSIPLKKTPNVLEAVVAQKGAHQLIVAFALENQGEEKRGLEKWEKNRGDILFLNTPLGGGPKTGFGEDAVRGMIVTRLHKEIPAALPLVSKFKLADDLLASLDQSL